MSVATAVAAGVVQILDAHMADRTEDAQFIVDDVKLKASRYPKMTKAVVLAAINMLELKALITEDDCLRLYQVLSEFGSQLDAGTYPTLVGRSFSPELAGEGWEPPPEVAAESAELIALRTQLSTAKESPLITKEELRALSGSPQEQLAFLSDLINTRAVNANKSPEPGSDAHIDAELLSEYGMTVEQLIEAARCFRFLTAEQRENVQTAMEVKPEIAEEANRRELPVILLNPLWASAPIATHIAAIDPVANATVTRTGLLDAMKQTLAHLAAGYQVADGGVGIASWANHLVGLAFPELVSQQHRAAAEAAAAADPTLLDEVHGACVMRYGTTKGFYPDLCIYTAEQGATAFSQAIHAAGATAQRAMRALPTFGTGRTGENLAAPAGALPTDGAPQEMTQESLALMMKTPPVAPWELPAGAQQAQPKADPPKVSAAETDGTKMKRKPWTYKAIGEAKNIIVPLVTTTPGITRAAFMALPEVVTMISHMRTDPDDLYKKLIEHGVITALPDVAGETTEAVDAARAAVTGTSTGWPAPQEEPCHAASIAGTKESSPSTPGSSPSPTFALHQAEKPPSNQNELPASWGSAPASSSQANSPTNGTAFPSTTSPMSPAPGAAASVTPPGSTGSGFPSATGTQPTTTGSTTSSPPENSLSSTLPSSLPELLGRLTTLRARSTELSNELNANNVEIRHVEEAIGSQQQAVEARKQQLMAELAALNAVPTGPAV